MKHSIIAKIFAATVAALALGLASSAKAQGCSTLTLRGTFAQTGSGVITSPPDMAGPFANVGTANFDGKGGMSGGLTVSLNGNSAQVSFTGTYTVNSDCTGTYTVQLSPIGVTSQAYFVMDNNAAELLILVTDPGSVVTCIMKRMFPGTTN